MQQDRAERLNGRSALASAPSDDIPAPWPNMMRYRILALVAICCVLGGCLREADVKFPYIENNTGQTVRVLLAQHGQGQGSEVIQIPPGSIGSLGNYTQSCTDVTIIIRDSNGNEIARRDDPLCPGEYWIVGARGSLSPT
jgi:hypothetical protein